jgi:hypothetical protein
LAQVIEQPDSLSLFTDGERRYGNRLFEIYHEVIRHGKPGRLLVGLPKGVRVRLKHKGSQKRPGRGAIVTRCSGDALNPEFTAMVRTELGSNQADGAKLLEVRM